MDPANFATLVQAIVAIATVIITGVLAPWLLKQQAIADNKLSEQQRNVLYPVLIYALTYGASRLGVSSAQMTEMGDTAKRALIDQAVAYTRQHVSGALDQLGVADDALRRMLEARWVQAANWMEAQPAPLVVTAAPAKE